MTGSNDTLLRVVAENGIEYAYRDLGEGDVPLVLLQHFRGNLDNWDPALIDALAANRRVITFDNVGVAATTGMTPNTIEAMAHDAIAFIDAMSFAAGRSTRLLDRQLRRARDRAHPPRPAAARGARVLGSAGRGGMHGWAPEVIGAVGKPETNPAGIPRRFLRSHRHEPRSRPAGSRADIRTNSRPRRADDLADPPGAVRRRLRLGHAEPLPAPTSRRDRSTGLRRQRRQRPHDPSPLLLPARRASPERAADDLPGLGARLSVPAPRRVRRRRPRVPRGGPTER